ncbi:MAG: squalene/phytoene synthase family protein, partial [Rhodobacter sp.]|nr:squalene/phytoene synthase family protein [Rhodobacter sp.]
MTVAACAALVQRGDPDRFMAVMAAPVAARAPLLVLYAFNLEVARAPWVTQEAMIAEMRLQWWRDTVAAMAGPGPVRAHEVATPLAEVVRARRLPLAVIDQ